MRVEVRFAHVREGRSELLGDCRDDPSCLLLPDEPKREPRSFVLATTKALGRKNGRVAGSFAAETCDQTTSFYRELVQDLPSSSVKGATVLADDVPAPVRAAENVKQNTGGASIDA